MFACLDEIITALQCLRYIEFLFILLTLKKDYLPAVVIVIVLF